MMAGYRERNVVLSKMDAHELEFGDDILLQYILSVPFQRLTHDTINEVAPLDVDALI